MLAFIMFKNCCVSVLWQFCLLLYHVSSNFAHLSTAGLLYGGRDQRVVILKHIIHWLSLVKWFVCSGLYPKDILS